MEYLEGLQSVTDGRGRTRAGRAGEALGVELGKSTIGYDFTPFISSLTLVHDGLLVIATRKILVSVVQDS